MRAIREVVAVSERRACVIAKCNRRMFRYKSRGSPTTRRFAGDSKNWPLSVDGSAIVGCT
ncbi:MAG: hypothetical protein ACXWNL_19490 [Vulcanimicrobiaceae bacterium]